jgi:hypothetical protein
LYVWSVTPLLQAASPEVVVAISIRWIVVVATDRAVVIWTPHLEVAIAHEAETWTMIADRVADQGVATLMMIAAGGGDIGLAAGIQGTLARDTGPGLVISAEVQVEPHLEVEEFAVTVVPHLYEVRDLEDRLQLKVPVPREEALLDPALTHHAVAHGRQVREVSAHQSMTLEI